MSVVGVVLVEEGVLAAEADANVSVVNSTYVN